MNLTILSLRSGMTNIMAGRSRRVKCADLMFRSGAGLIFRALQAVLWSVNGYSPLNFARAQECSESYLRREPIKNFS